MRKEKGFSLIELLLVVGIAAIIFAFAAPLSLNLYRSQLVEEASSDLTDALQRARHYAVLQKNDSAFGVHFIPATNEYILFQGENYEDPDGVNGRDRSQDEEPVAIISDISISGLTDIVFSKLTGLTATTSTTTLTYGKSTRQFLVEASGGISKIETVAVAGGGGEYAGTLGNELVAHWKMNDADCTTVEDTKGNDGSGTCTSVDGYVGSGALSFNGTTDWVNLGAPASFDLGTGDFSFAFWMKAPTNGYAGLIGNRFSSINSDFFNITMPNNGYITLETANTYNSPLISDSPVTDEGWHHVVILRDAGTLNMYIDNVLQTSVITGNTDNIYSPTVDVRFGQYYTDLNDYPYLGLMDDVRIYSRALTPDEIAELEAGTEAE